MSLSGPTIAEPAHDDRPGVLPPETETIVAAAEATAPALPARNLCMILVAIIAALAFMHWAEAFLVPLLFAILLGYTLDPLVGLLQRCYLPRALGAFVVLGAVAALCGSLFYSLSDDAAAVTELVPQATGKLRALVREVRVDGGTKPLANLRKAASELDKAAAEATGGSAPAARSAPVAADTGVHQWLLAQSAHAARVVTQLGMAMLLAYFLLAAGDAFRRKLARLAGPRLAGRRVVVNMLNDIDDRIQRYMATIVLTNVLIALATWGTLALLGIEHALFWGVLAGLLHLIPYVGSSIAAAAVGLIGLAQLDQPWHALLAAAGVIAIAGLIGMVFTTWLQARACKINAVVVIAGVLFFGWLWGGWGLILAVPILTTLKTIADTMDEWRPVSELLAE